MLALSACIGEGCAPWTILGLGLLGFLHMLQGDEVESALDQEGLKSLPALMSYILCVKKHGPVLELPALALHILCRLFLI